MQQRGDRDDTGTGTENEVSDGEHLADTVVAAGADTKAAAGKREVVGDKTSGGGGGGVVGVNSHVGLVADGAGGADDGDAADGGSVILIQPSKMVPLHLHSISSRDSCAQQTQQTHLSLQVSAQRVGHHERRGGGEKRTTVLPGPAYANTNPNPNPQMRKMANILDSFTVQQEGSFLVNAGKRGGLNEAGERECQEGGAATCKKITILPANKKGVVHIVVGYPDHVEKGLAYPVQGHAAASVTSTWQQDIQHQHQQQRQHQHNKHPQHQHPQHQHHQQLVGIRSREHRTVAEVSLSGELLGQCGEVP
jgi:hypothetical protein